MRAARRSSRRRRRIPARRAPLVDAMLAAYVDWREDAAAAAEAYKRWSGAPRGEATWRYLAYMAGLEQEESSANRYAQALRAVERWAAAA
jgi:hypothetical protein